MKKAAIISLSALALFAGACKKKETTKTTPVTPTSPYYYNFKLNDTSHNFSGGFAQYIFLYANEAGGYQASGNNFAPCGWVSFNVAIGDTISESQLLGLKGRTIYFDDTVMHPAVGFDYDISAYEGWQSVDTSDHNYYVKITDVSYLKNDTSINTPLRSYVLKGTCNALVQRYGVVKVMSGGDFNLRIGKMDLK